MAHFSARALILFSLCAPACDRGPGAESEPDAEPGQDAESSLDAGAPDAEAAADAAIFPAQGEFEVEDCEGENGIDDPCYWRYQIDPDECSAASPCAKLVIAFSGGEMNCDDSYGNDEAGYSQALTRYSENGYVAVCAGVFLTNDLSATVPFNDEAKRIELVVDAIRASEIVASVWDGSELLFAGVSHGASAPAVVMARTTLDDLPAFQGSKKTAACLHDGTYDVLATDQYLREFPLACSALREPVVCRRYFQEFSGACPVPSLDDPEVAADTVVSVEPSVFAIKDWKIIECGSAKPGCLAPGDADRDWLPASTMNAFCDNLDAGADHRCTLDPMPDDGHLTCFGTIEGIDKCRLWFDALP
jgi:hypothetical protein